MFTSVAYLGRHSEDITDTSQPLTVTAVGYYRHVTKDVHTVRPNGRSDYQLIYVADGQAHLTVNGEERHLGKGNMILFRPRVPQKYSFCAKDATQVYWVHFTGAAVEQILSQYTFPTNSPYFFAGSCSEYELIYTDMIRELQLRRANYAKMLSCALERLLMLSDRYLKEKLSGGGSALDEAERAVRFFNDNYNRNISVESYAKQHHVSVCWFIKSFTQLTRLTPMQYIISVRIANAKSLLSDTNQSVSQIASAVGYDNSLYFSRIFKKHTGLTPSQYRHSATDGAYAQKE